VPRPSFMLRISENSVKAKFPAELTYPIAPALMLQLVCSGRASTITHIYPSVLQALAGRGYAGCLER